MTIATLPDVAGLQSVSFAGRRAFARVVDALGFDASAADALAAVISHESRWSPTARNPSSGAIGLLQFMPSTARHLGTTPEAIGTMTIVEQLELVRRFFAPFGPLAARDVPIAPYLPGLVGHPDEETSFSRGSKGYKQNAGLDTDKDGRITLGEVRRDVLRALDGAAGRPRLPVEDGGMPIPTTDASGRRRGLGVLVTIGIGLAALLHAGKKWAA